MVQGQVIVSYFIDESGSRKTQGEELGSRSCDKCTQEVGTQVLSNSAHFSSLAAVLVSAPASVGDEPATLPGIREQHPE